MSTVINGNKGGNVIYKEEADCDADANFDTTPVDRKKFPVIGESIRYLFNLCVLIIVFRRFLLLPLGFLYRSSRRSPTRGLFPLSLLFLLLFIPLGKEIVQTLL